MPTLLMVAVAFWGTVLGGGFYFARRHLRMREARNPDTAQLTELRARVDALEEAAKVARGEIERLETGQEFTPMASLAERFGFSSASAACLQNGERDSTDGTERIARDHARPIAIPHAADAPADRAH